VTCPYRKSNAREITVWGMVLRRLSLKNVFGKLERKVGFSALGAGIVRAIFAPRVGRKQLVSSSACVAMMQPANVRNGEHGSVTSLDFLYQGL
jgi:hypothetical protein